MIFIRLTLVIILSVVGVITSRGNRGLEITSEVVNHPTQAYPPQADKHNSASANLVELPRETCRPRATLTTPGTRTYPVSVLSVSRSRSQGGTVRKDELFES